MEWNWWIYCFTCVSIRPCALILFRCEYLKNSLRWTLGNNYPLIGNILLRIERWRHRWRHVTLKGQGRDPNIFKARYFKNGSRKTRLQLGTYRRWQARYRMVTWSMMSRDPEMSMSWLRYVYMQISRIQFEIDTWYQLPTNRKWPLADRIMTSSMTSRDRKRSRLWSQYLYGSLFRKRLEIETRLQRGIYKKWHARYRMVTWSMTSRDPEKSKLWPSYI